MGCQNLPMVIILEGESYFLDNLLLLNQESTDNALANAVGAARASVGTADGLGGLRDLSELAGAEGRNL